MRMPLITFIITFSIVLASCGGSGGSGGSQGGGSTSSPPPPQPTPTAEPAPPTPEPTQEPSPSVLSGIFIDSAVEGLRYSTATQQGSTDSDGTFQYISGEMITFSIGDIQLPSITASAQVSPLDIFSTDDIDLLQVANLSRLLQSLDSDGDASNGILITEQAHQMSLGMTLDFGSDSFDTDVVNLVANSGSTRTSLVSTEAAIAHLRTSLNLMTGIDSCGDDHPLVGSSAEFSTNSNNVSGTATVVSNCRIEITNFTYNGEGPRVAFYSGIDGDYEDGLMLHERFESRVYDNESITINLPPNIGLSRIDGISVWCFQFNNNFGDAVF